MYFEKRALLWFEKGQNTCVFQTLSNCDGVAGSLKLSILWICWTFLDLASQFFSGL